MYKDGRTRTVQHDVSAQLPHICMAERRHPTMEEAMRVRRDGVSIEEPSQWT